MVRKKILIFHQSLAPYRVDFWNSLNDAFDLEVFFIYENHLDQKFDQGRLKKLLNFTPKYLNIGVDVGSRALRWGFVSIIRRVKPEIVFSYEYSQTTTSLYLIKKIYGMDFQLFSICDDSLEIAKTCVGMRRLFRDFLVNKLDGLILVNQDVADWYIQKFGAGKKRIVFPIITKEKTFRDNLIDSLSKTNKLIEEFNLIGKKCVFYVGRLVKVKGLDRLIDVFYNIAHKKEDVRLVMIGDGDQKEQLKLLSNHYGMDKKIFFPGRMEGQELLSWYNLAQIFVLPSHYEPFGAVINEALLAGSIVLCSKLAGASSLIKTGENGYNFDPYDKALLENLLNQEIDKISSITGFLKDIKPSNMLVSFEDYFDNLYKELNR
ncbi:glycosyltransferase [Pedobacter sp. MC2016-24]|uniref:glycosyltransferase n=1 Tax=Pedobacter sp. MC2016-24 TaxID=2780090 RepID=UPI00187EB5EF|nr:glycosyltransferase [Pedobacter sp. MC2016-24]MBE9599526.1 glycosyltransferase [Pedobacter sp. MC2016-24]